MYVDEVKKVCFNTKKSDHINMLYVFDLSNFGKIKIKNNHEFLM